MIMRCILSESIDPYFNIASEEVLLKHRKEDYFLLYRNQPSVVVGKHQNTLAEVNMDYVRDKGFHVVRRISGGGTVYHDLGNINFAFITTGKEGELVDYARHTLPLIKAMEKLGLAVSLGKRNELLLDGKKISGTASHVYKNRALHHGTLLFSSAMKELGDSLRVKSDRFRDRAVKSIPSRVTNVREHLVDKMSVENFMMHIYGYTLENMEGAVSYSYRGKDVEEIKELKDSRFSTWEWNFGYSPRYQFSRDLHIGKAKIALHMNVEKGIIQEVSIQGDFMGARDVHALEEVLVGTIHDPETLRQRLSGIDVGDYITGLANEKFLSGMF